MGGKRVRRRARRRVVPLLVLCVVAGLGVAWGLSRLREGPATDSDALDPVARSSVSPSATPSVSPSTRAPSPTTSSPPVTPSPATPGRRAGKRPEAPARIRLPSGATVPVVPVGALADGVLDVPDDIRTAGWWRGGSRLGDPFGSTLVAAHIDSRTQGLGPYVELLSVRRDDRIRVSSAHLVQQFHVTSLRLLPRGSLAAVTDLFSAAGPRRLTMVTCAGPYDAARGGYQNLAVVTARPVTGPRTRSSA